MGDDEIAYSPRNNLLILLVVGESNSWGVHKEAMLTALGVRHGVDSARPGWTTNDQDPRANLLGDRERTRTSVIGLAQEQ